MGTLEVDGPFRSLQTIELVDVLVAEKLCLGVSMMVAYVDENLHFVRTEKSAHWAYPVLDCFLRVSHYH